MKKFFFSSIIIFLIILSLLCITLLTSGIKTDKFDSYLTSKINDHNKHLDLNINSIRFKLDYKEISLFLETSDPQITYRNTSIPAKKIKVYVDFLSLLSSSPDIKKINLIFYELKIDQFKNLAKTLKPSNFKSIVHNKILKGTITLSLEIFLGKDNIFENFIARGDIKGLTLNTINKINLENLNFNFFADKSDVLLKEITGNILGTEIEDGDLRVNLSNIISVESNFLSKINFKKGDKIRYKEFFKNINFFENIETFKVDLNNNFSIKFDQTYKVKDFSFKSNGLLQNAHIKFEEPIKNFALDRNIDFINLKNSRVLINLDKKLKSINLDGLYSFDSKDYLEFKMTNEYLKNSFALDIQADLKEKINLKVLNYTKKKDTKANLSFNLTKRKNDLRIKELNFSHDDTQISINGLIISNGNITSIDKLKVKTYLDGKNNNDFTLILKDKILINGTKADASNLPKILSENSRTNNFKKINKNIDINIKNIIAPLSENLKNFKLLGFIENGKFSSITSKGDFGNNKHLDITMKNNKKDNKKYLEIYSDLTSPLLTNYSFFKGLSGGNLLYTSILEENYSTSKLKIENFKVVNAPGVIKLLSLADLGGLADLAEGEGITFDVLEINMEKSQEELKLNEILALGPSMSVLIEGYQNSNITSLRGTLVPAKTLNKFIAKIPLIGDIVIPKEVGEGLFGISFKMKGPPGQIKTSINPIKTLTPRFIQKVIEKNKN
tara:strand:+ start:6408 stop:8588 length:2181 start_codon:yes stop_codon:yes gene_type:complete